MLTITNLDTGERVTCDYPTVKVVPARSCHCHVADTDNNGVCYTCGGYIASRDAGRYI